MTRLIWILALALALPAFGQAPTRVVSTIADLDALYPGSSQPHVLVQGYSSSGDWGAPKAFRWDSTNALSTNAIRRATRNGVGRWIHDWDGDAGAFGVLPATSDNGARINEALPESISRGIPLLVAEGTYDLRTSPILSSGSIIRGSGSRKTIFRRSGRLSSETNSLAYATIQTLGAFNPYTSNGIPGPSAQGSVSNIVLEGFSLTEAPGSFSGFPLALFASDSVVRGVHVYGVTNHWAIAALGDRISIVDNEIDNVGRSYQDGIHFLGGRGLIVARNIIRSGDDCIAISTGGSMDPHVQDVLVYGNYCYSSHAHAIRIFQENASALRRFSRINVSGNVGRSGIQRNGGVRISSSSTNAGKNLEYISVTFTAIPTNGSTITINGDVRTWGVSGGSNTIQNASSLVDVVQSFVSHFGAYPVSGTAVSDDGITGVEFSTAFGQTNAVSTTGAWASVTQSTNTFWPLEPIFNNNSFTVGSLAEHGGTPDGFGFYVSQVSGAKFTDTSIGSSLFEGWRIVDSGEVELNNCSAEGAEYTAFFNTTVRAENVSKLLVSGGKYYNKHTNGFSTFFLSSVGSAEFRGAYISNQTSGGAAISYQTNGTYAAGTHLLLEDCTIDAKSTGLYSQSGVIPKVYLNNNRITAPTTTSLSNTVVVSSWGNRGYSGDTNETVRGQLSVESTLTAQQSAVVGQQNSFTSLEVKGGNSGAAIVKLTRTNQPQVGLISSGGLIVQDLTSNWITATLNSFQGSVEWRLGGNAYVPSSYGRTSVRPAYIRGESASGTDIPGNQMLLYLPSGTGTGSVASVWLSVFSPTNSGVSGSTAQPTREVFRVGASTGATNISGLRMENEAGDLKIIKIGADGTGPGGVGRALYIDP